MSKAPLVEGRSKTSADITSALEFCSPTIDAVLSPFLAADAADGVGGVLPGLAGWTNMHNDDDDCMWNGTRPSQIQGYNRQKKAVTNALRVE